MKPKGSLQLEKAHYCLLIHIAVVENFRGKHGCLFCELIHSDVKITEIVYDTVQNIVSSDVLSWIEKGLERR